MITTNKFNIYHHIQLQFFSCDENFKIYSLSNFSNIQYSIVNYSHKLYIIGLITGSLYLLITFTNLSTMLGVTRIRSALSLSTCISMF